MRYFIENIGDSTMTGGGIVPIWGEKIDNTRLASNPRRGCQSRRSASDRDAQSQAAGGYRSAVPDRGLLRPARPAASSLRDGAAASRRGRTNRRDGATVRRLATDGLSGPRRLQGRWACRSAAQATWAEARAQAYTGGAVAYRAETTGTTQFARQRFVGGPAAHLRSHDSSPQPRAAAQGPKKTSGSLNAAHCCEDAVSYENLRRYALFETPAQDTATLSTLLRRGLAAWLRATPAPGSRSSPGTMPSRMLLPAALASIILRLTKEAAHA